MIKTTATINTPVPKTITVTLEVTQERLEYVRAILYENESYPNTGVFRALTKAMQQAGLKTPDLYCANKCRLADAAAKSEDVL